MRTGSLLFLFGILLLCRLPVLPPVTLSIFLLLFILPAARYARLRRVLWLAAGFFWALFRAELMLSDNLTRNLEGVQLQVEGRVVSLPVNRGTVVRFDFKPDVMTDGRGNEVDNPGLIRLNWYRTYPEIIPGEKWRLFVKLKRPWGFKNPGGFDYEGFLFRENIGATGYVIGRLPANRLGPPDRLYIGRLRYQIRETLARILEDKPVNSLIIALVTGDRSAITPSQWEVLTKTGTSHLLAISGLHIGLVAGLVFLITRRLWPVLGVMSYRYAGPRVAAVCAVSVAVFYSALAGFSVPTQRAMMMLGCVMLLLCMNKATRPSSIIALVLLLVLIIDPFSVMSAGFWLSFCAIIIILFGMTCRKGVNTLWWRWARVQYIIAAGLTPVLVLWFQQVPLLSVPANLIAVPWVSMLTVPFVISGTLCWYFSGALGLFLLRIGVCSLELLWQLLEFAGRLEFTILHTALPSIPVMLASLIGVVLLISPRGLPGRWLGIIWLLPLCVKSPGHPVHGDIHATLLDVGQGLAMVIRTENHTLLYDSGPRYSDRFDAGSDIILPNLKFQGVKRLDMLIASHGDSDHIGGLPAVLDNIYVQRIITSVPEKINHTGATFCRTGDNWQWDGVTFTVLHPDSKEVLSGNNLSCVIKISTGSHSMLLTGDIEKHAEHILVLQYGEKLRSDILIAPHHGSGTSSTIDFIQAVQPVYVLFPAGYRNRFNFPKRDIIDRYLSRGVISLNTAVSGAVEIYIDKNGINIVEIRKRSRRFWNTEY